MTTIYTGSTKNHDKLNEIVTYYVLWSPSRRLYINARGKGFGAYREAHRRHSHDDADWDKNFFNEECGYDVKVVGPCQEGEEP
jgi:hypothetical protein